MAVDQGKQIFSFGFVMLIRLSKIPNEAKYEKKKKFTLGKVIFFLLNFEKIFLIFFFSADPGSGAGILILKTGSESETI